MDSTTQGPFDPSTNPTPANNASQKSLEISVGLVINAKHVFWGSCVATFMGTRAVYPPANLRQQLLEVLLERVKPALVGQSLHGYRQLLEIIYPLTNLNQDKSTSIQQLPVELPHQDGLEAWIQPPPPPLNRDSPIERFDSEEWIHRAVHFGVSQATLEALAALQNLTKAEVISGAYNLPQPDKHTPILVTLDRLQTRVVDWVPNHNISAVGLTTSGKNILSELGRDAEQLQRAIRALSMKLSKVGASPEKVKIHLDVQGGLGLLHRFDSGKILGSLYGIEQAAEPYLLQVQNPVVLDSVDAQIQKLSDLRQLVKDRKMGLRLIAGAWAYTLAHIEKIARSEATDLIHIDLFRIGDIDLALRGGIACRSTHQKMIFTGASTYPNRWSELTCHLSLAMQADFLAIQQSSISSFFFPAYQQEMSRTITWIKYRKSK